MSLSQFIVSLLIIIGYVGAFLENNVDSTAPVAETNCGKVEGLWSKSDRAYSFKGIPYASPPVGNLRWRPPVRTALENNNCWTGIFSADTFRSQCVQRSIYDVKNIVGSEDCLYLSVFTPSLNTNANLPVLFWIHGGYLTFGNGNQNDEGYAPTPELARSLNVVFVSINYRLNAFGFMALDMLRHGSPTNTSGNYGFMDQIASLQWVQDNIRNFGGDPTKVTVFGQSSGGTSIFALLASPLSQGLFSKAWMLSASPVMNKTAYEAFEDNLVFLNNTGCSDVECLYNLSAEEVAKSVPWDSFPYWGMTDLMSLPEKGRFDGALAVIDGYVLYEPPFDAWVNGHGIDVPVMIGTTAQETDVAPDPPEIVNATWDSNDDLYTRLVYDTLGEYGDIVHKLALKFYPVNVSSPEMQLATMISDMRINCGNDYLSLVLAKSLTSPVYRYVATYYSQTKAGYPFASTVPVRYAYHGVDIFGFFETLGTIYKVKSVDADDVAFANNMQREVMSFVLNGHPDTPSWSPFPDATAELHVNTSVLSRYHADECMFWFTNGFFSYSWIN